LTPLKAAEGSPDIKSGAEKGRFSYRESLTPLKAAEGSPDVKSGAEKGIEE